MPPLTAKSVQYVPLKIICQERSYLYFHYFFFTITYISCSTIGKFSVLNLMYGPKKTQKDLSFPAFKFVVSGASLLTRPKVPKCGLVVIFQY